MRDIDITELARTEVAGLHEFFVEWFHGAVPDTDAAYARFDDALHPEFTMVVTTGVVLPREAVLGFVRQAHGSRDDTFRIETPGFTPLVTAPGSVLATYAEWQYDGDELLTARTSTVYFVADAHAPGGVAWRHLHETMQHTP